MAATDSKQIISLVTEDGHQLAIKTLPKTMTAFQELAVLQAVQGHPNIIPLIKSERTSDHIKIYMPYFPQTLLSLLESYSDGFPLPRVKYIFTQLISALEHIHGHHFVHHDIKLENILIDANDHIYLIDFGYARPYTPGLRACSSQHGSTHYAAPEIWLQRPREGPEVDVWAAGVCLYLLVTGYFPFGGATQQETWEEIQEKDLYKDERLEPVLFDLLQRMLEYESEARITLEEIRKHPWMEHL